MLRIRPGQHAGIYVISLNAQCRSERWYNVVDQALRLEVVSSTLCRWPHVLGIAMPCA